MPPKKLDLDVAESPAPMSVEKETPRKWASPQQQHQWYRRWEQNNWWSYGGWDGWDSWSGAWEWEKKGAEEDTTESTANPARTICGNSEASTHGSEVRACLGRQRTSPQELEHIAEEAADFQAKLEQAIDELEATHPQATVVTQDTQATLVVDTQEMEAIATAAISASSAATAVVPVALQAS